MPSVIATVQDRLATQRERHALERQLWSFSRSGRLDLEARLDARGDDEETQALRSVLRRAAA